MVRNVDYKERKDRLLAAAIGSYIRNDSPVSSQELCGAFDLSPASIRNLLAELETEGLLTHPHTSAGRVPTDRGYRYYIDFLLKDLELSAEEKHSILKALKAGMASLEDILEKASETIARLTHYASVVSSQKLNDRFFFSGLSNILEQPEFQDGKKLLPLVKILEEKRPLLDILNAKPERPLKVFIGEELRGLYLHNECALVVSVYGRQRDIEGRIAVLGPRRMSYELTLPTVEFIAQALGEMLEDV
ncbi:MAG: HrcA family transcriptional regulator [Candidatus Omnitrophota bacterium]